MRALSIDSVSGRTVIAPSSTSLTKLRTRSLPRSRCAWSVPNRPWSTICSSKLVAVVGALSGTAEDCVPVSGLAIGSSRLQLALELVQSPLVVQHGLQDLLELVVALQAAPKIGELLSKFQQLPQWLHLLRDTVGGEVVQVLELELHAELAPVFFQLVVDFDRQARLHALQNVVEVVGCDLDELSILEPRKRLGGVTAEVSEHAHDERQLLHLDRVADFHIVGDVDARRAHAL